MMKTSKLLLSAVMLLMPLGMSAQRHFEQNLWTGNAPYPTSDAADTAKVKVFLPNEKKATGRAVIICPGGSYRNLSMNNEGVNWAGWLNNQGIAAIVLKYRMPHGQTMAPVSDAEEAIRLVRRNAAAWHINRQDVGIMGFSAGGHLASTIATHSKMEAKPDFQILFYPVITMMPGYTHQDSHNNLLGSDAHKKEEREYSNDQQVTRVTPRAFIALSDDDDIVQPANGVNYYVELYRHDVPATLHVYPGGGHGWGMSADFRYHVEMLLDLKAWLSSF